MRHNWREEEKKKIDQLKNYADALERREKFLISALAKLAQGYGIEVTGKPWTVAMQKFAGNELEEVAKMRVPLRPFI